MAKVKKTSASNLKPMAEEADAAKSVKGNKKKSLPPWLMKKTAK